METLISEPFFSFLFVGAGLAFLLFEVFVPTGGVLGVLSLGSICFGIYGLFHQGRTFLAVAATAGTGVAVLFGLRFGLRRLAFRGSLPPETVNSVDEEIEGLLGKEGVTTTPLRPAGMALIEGKKIDVVTQGGYVGKDARVRVVDTTGNRVVVRVVSPEGEPSAGRPFGG